jgi:hypothetical protein
MGHSLHMSINRSYFKDVPLEIVFKYYPAAILYVRYVNHKKVAVFALVGLLYKSLYQCALSIAKANFGDKKVEAPRKIP